jgi:hypothetical protein
VPLFRRECARGGFSTDDFAAWYFIANQPAPAADASMAATVS